MGGCCAGRNVYEALLDDFFNNMKIIEESTDDVYELIDMNIDNSANFYNGKLVNFMKNFYENHIKGNNEKMNVEYRNYFEFEFNSAIQHNILFGFASFLIFLSKSENRESKPYSSSILKLANKFKIEINNEKEIAGKELDSLLFSYIRFVSTDAVTFVKVLSNNPAEFNDLFIKNFKEDSVLKLKNELMEGHIDSKFIDVHYFIEQNIQRLHHSEIRQRLIEISNLKH